MYSWSFSWVEGLAIPIILTLFYFYLYIKSLFLLGDYYSSNPLFEKRKLTYLNQATNLTDNLSKVVFFYFVFSLFQHKGDADLDVVNSNNYLVIIFFFVFLLIKISDVFYSGKSTRVNDLAGINSSNTYILLFIPIGGSLVSSNDLIVLILSVELLSFITYFVFLETPYQSNTNQQSEKNKNNALSKGVIYFFWLGFIGSSFLVMSTLITLMWSPTLEWRSIAVYANHSEARAAVQSSAFFLFLGLTLKAGGIFFFFFKSEVYKILSVFSIAVFVSLTSFFYLLTLGYLITKIVLFGVFLKYFVCLISGIITGLVLLVHGINLKSLRLFLGVSSAVTVCFCVVTLV